MGLAPEIYNKSKSQRLRCPKCGSVSMARAARHGFWQQSFFPKFGFYPWECSSCRIVKLLRNRGVRVRKRRRTEEREEAPY